MALGALKQTIAAPAADASRVAAIRNKLDLNNAADIAGFGEQACKALLAGVERLLTEVRNNPVGDAAERLQAAVARIDKFDPNELEPRGGLDNMFNGRNARLHRFQRAFEGAGQVVHELATELDARVARLGRQSEALNGLHEQARTLILELDAYLDAGRARLDEALASAPPPAPVAEAAPETPEGDAAVKPAPEITPADRLGARLDDLNRARSAALHQLPLVRVIQNAEAFLADDLGKARAAISAWRASWNDLLGIGRGKERVRPPLPALAEGKLRAVEGLNRVIANLADHNARRADGEVRMKAAASTALKA